LALNTYFIFSGTRCHDHFVDENVQIWCFSTTFLEGNGLENYLPGKGKPPRPIDKNGRRHTMSIGHG
jgi:hypothetical protein